MGSTHLVFGSFFFKTSPKDRLIFMATGGCSWLYEFLQDGSTIVA